MLRSLWCNFLLFSLYLAMIGKLKTKTNQTTPKENCLSSSSTDEKPTKGYFDRTKTISTTRSVVLFCCCCWTLPVLETFRGSWSWSSKGVQKWQSSSIWEFLFGSKCSFIRKIEISSILLIGRYHLYVWVTRLRAITLLDFLQITRDVLSKNEHIPPPMFSA